MCSKMGSGQIERNSEVHIWSDGERIRSFCYGDDCVEGILGCRRRGYLYIYYHAL